MPEPSPLSTRQILHFFGLSFFFSGNHGNLPVSN